MAAFPNVAVRNVAGFNIPQFTSVELSYVSTTNNLDTVVYKEGTTTVATLTFTYVGGTPGADDADIATITKSLMAFKFNPFTGTLDQTGSGGGASYIDGEVQNFSALPETIGTPAVDSAYLVREAEGTWLLARKPAGIYIRTADTGVRVDDWTHASAFPDVFSDAAFTVYSDGDSTKNLQLSLSGITTGQTRTLTVPNKSGTIATTNDIPFVNDIELTHDGTTTVTTAQLPARGIAYAPEGESTYTVNLPTPDIRQSGLTFSLKTEYEEGTGTVFVTVVHAAVNLLTSYELDEDEGSIDFVWDGYAWRYDAAYRLRSFPSRVLQLPAASGTIARTEDFASPPVIGSTTPNTAAFTTLTASSLVASGNVVSDSNLRMRSNTGQISLGAANDVQLYRGNTASVLELRGTTNPQTFRLYGTFTTATNYQRMTVRSVKQTLSALSGASATTTGTLIPDGAVVVGVTTRVATAITGATGYQVGDGTDADRWGDINAIALNTTSDNRDWTAGTIECFTSGGEVTLTANGSNFTAGAVEICVFYLAGEAD
jgi:hypothetical protein